MKLTFCGAAGEVTGSCYLLQAEGKNILIDCGLFQGGEFATEKNHEPFPFDPKTIDYVLLTHAHQDHCGRLPKLYKDGFHGKVFATEPTIELTNLMLADSAHIMAEDAREKGFEPLYAEKDLMGLLPLFKKLEYNKKLKILPNLHIQFRDAGHILGAAVIEVWVADKKIVFSGDIGHKSMLLIRDLAEIEEADYVVCESTYGDRLHEDSGSDKKLVFKNAIDDIVKQKGVLIIPAFALERTQEILYELNDLVETKAVEPIDIFVDSPLAIRVTQTFSQYDDYFNLEAKKHILGGDDVFEFAKLQFTSDVTQSKYINNSPKPKVILAGSGMLNGGRIIYHLQRYLPDPTTHLMFVGYQVRGTLGREIMDGAKNVQIKGHPIEIKAKVTKTESFSGHADKHEIQEWLKGFQKKRLKKIFLSHGDEESRTALAGEIKTNFDAEVVLPALGQSFEL